MIDLDAVGLEVWSRPGIGDGEKRIEIRLNGDFVAWFRSRVRMITRTVDGKKITEKVESATYQFVRRRELTSVQESAVDEWLDEQKRQKL